MATHEISEEDRALVETARKGLDAHTPHNPYSGFGVAAAVAVEGGAPVVGTNIENVALGSSICAERSALSTAHNLGFGDRCRGVAIVGRDGVGTPESATPPCGECRQVLWEFAHRSNTQDTFFVLLSGAEPKKVLLKELLPEAFGPEQLRG